MTKNALILLSVATALITMGAGCATQSTNNTTTTPVAVVTTTTQEIASFSIKELGITFSIPAEYKDDLAYKMNSPANTFASMYSKSLSSKSVMGQDSNCGPGALGSFIKSKKLYNDFDDTERQPSPGYDIKIGDEYITFHGPQDLCTSNMQLGKEIENRIKALQTALPTVRALATSSTSSTADWKTYQDANMGVSFSFKYPSSWTYQKFSCNLDGVAFCPLAGNSSSNCRVTCGMNSPTSSIYLYPFQGEPVIVESDTIKYWKEPNISLDLNDSEYKNIYTEMISSFEYSK